jgi:hypothetical protein
VLNANNEKLPDSLTLRFLQFDALPDYVSERSSGPFRIPSIWHDNRDYWREEAEYRKTQLSLIQVQFELANRSNFALANAKLEISVEALDGQSFKMLATHDLPNEPEAQSNGINGFHTVADIMLRREKRFIVDEGGSIPLCHARLGTLLPGEAARATDSLAVLPSGPGRMRIHVRVLAEELATPIEHDRLIEVTGASETHDLEGLWKVMDEGV